MAEQIVQTLGFDASGAITTINTLNTSLASLAARLNSVAQGARAFNQAGITRTFKNLSSNNPAPALNNAANAANNLGQNLATAGSRGGQAMDNLNKRTESLTISWQTLSRIIIAQAIVRSINAITSAVSNSISETRELQKRIGEIQTIAGAGATAEGIGANLTATAEQFGFDILDVAEAKYQELSNQVEGSTESLKLQQTAAKLARATNSSLTDSINLLSSVLNAFGKDASQAEQTAGLLFKTIEQGRIRASELSNTLGRVAPLANALSVDFDELGGALARITQGGTRADTAITQLLGILNKLSKPTTELSGAFRELGVATAQEGIQQSGGLLPFLQRLQEVAGDNGTLVKFFNNVRAIQGVLALLGTDGQKTSEVFEQIAQTSLEASDALNGAFDTATANDAVTYEQLVAKLDTQFRDLATQAIPLINSALSFFIDTLEDIRNNPLFSGALFAAASGGLIGVGLAAGSAATGVTAFAASAAAAAVAFAPLTLAVGAFVVTLTALEIAAQAAEEADYAGLVSRGSAVLTVFKNNVEQSTLALAEQAQAIKESAAEVSDFGQQFTTLRREALSALTELNRDFTTSSQSALSSVLQSRRAVSKEIQNAVSQADKLIEQSANKITDIQVKKEDFLLNRRIKNLSEAQQAAELYQASQQQAFRTRGSLNGVTDLDQFDNAADALERRLQLAQQGLQAANASGNVGAIARAEQQVVTALNDQINLERQRQQIINARKKAAEEAAAADAAQTNQLKSLVGDIKKELDILNNDGQLLNPERLAQQEAKVNDLLGQLRTFGLDNEQIDLTEFLGIQDLASTFSRDIDAAIQGISGRRSEITGEIEKIYQDLNGIVDDNIIKIAVELDLTEGGPDQLSSLVEATSNAAKEFENLTSAQNRYDEAQESAIANARLFQQAFLGTTGPDDFAERVTGSVNRIINDTELARGKALEFIKVFREAAEADSRIDVAGPNVGDAAVLKELDGLYANLVQSRERLAAVEESTAEDRQRLELIKQFQQQAESNVNAVQAGIGFLNGTEDAIVQINTATLQTLNLIGANQEGWVGVTDAANRAKNAVDAYSRAVQSAPQAPSGAGVVNRMFGGKMMYRAGGGFARGTDTIPAMLSPGEFVVNARSARQFASQLTAMNAGVNPVYRQEGGPVVNNTVNVGDINVNGTSGNNDSIARSVVSQIRREFRRGTASRF